MINKIMQFIERWRHVLKTIEEAEIGIVSPLVMPRGILTELEKLLQGEYVDPMSREYVSKLGVQLIAAENKVRELEEKLKNPNTYSAAYWYNKAKIERKRTSELEKELKVVNQTRDAQALKIMDLQKRSDANADVSITYLNTINKLKASIRALYEGTKEIEP